MITIEQISHGQRKINDFIDIPYDLYRDDNNWCPPLKIERKEFFSDKNPFMDNSRVAYFIAYKDAKPVGRVTAHVDNFYNSYHKVRQGFFGFFECINDLEIAKKMMKTAENWLRSNGMDSIMGPFNFSTNQEVGFITEGFERPPVIMMPYNKRYYSDLLGQLSYIEKKKLLAYWMENVTQPPKMVTRFAKSLVKRYQDSVQIRNFDMKNLSADLEIILSIYNEAWGRNWGFVPMTYKEIDTMANQLKLFVDQKYTYLLYRNGEPAAFLLAVPDINELLIDNRSGKLFPTAAFKLLFGRKKIKTLRVLLMGIKRKFRNLGLDILLYHKIFQEGIDKKVYKNVEMSWICDDNRSMINILEKMNAVPYKHYAILGKPL